MNLKRAAVFCTLLAAAGTAGVAGVAATSSAAAKPSQPAVSAADIRAQAQHLPSVASAREAIRESGGNGRKVAVIVQGTDFFAIEAAPDGFSTGDMFLFGADVYDKTGTSVIGRDAERCQPGFNSYLCDITVSIDGKGLLQVDGSFINDKNAIPVTGGTGAFRGVGGAMHVFLVDGDESKELYVFDLTTYGRLAAVAAASDLCDGGRPARYLKSLEDVVEVCPHCPLGQGHPMRYLNVRIAHTDERQHLHLTTSQTDRALATAFGVSVGRAHVGTEQFEDEAIAFSEVLARPAPEEDRKVLPEPSGNTIINSRSRPRGPRFSLNGLPLRN